MTIAQHVDVARRPGLYTAEQVGDSLRYWNRKAFTAQDESFQALARTWYFMCAAALQSKEG